MKAGMKRRRKRMRLKAALWHAISYHERIWHSWKHAPAKRWVLGQRYGDAVEPAVLEFIASL
jgi:hypothetical protein